MTAEGAQGSGAGDLAELAHEWDGLAASVFGDLEELLEVGAVDVFLAGEVDVESGAGEEAVEALAEVDVGFAVEEDPAVGAEELVGHVDDAGPGEGGGVEDLAGHVACGGDDDEPGSGLVSNKILKLEVHIVV